MLPSFQQLVSNMVISQSSMTSWWRHFPQLMCITLLEKLLACIISFTKCWLKRWLSLWHLKTWVLLILFHCCAEFSSFISVAAHWSIKSLVYCHIIQNKWWSNSFSNFFRGGAFAKTCSLLSLGRRHYDTVWRVLCECGVIHSLLLLMRTNNTEGFHWEVQRWVARAKSLIHDSIFAHKL